LAKFLADNASRRIDANTMMIDAFNRDFLLCSPLVREKGEAKPLRKCRKCQKYQVHCICQKEEPRTKRPNYLIHTDYSGDHIYPDLTKFH